MNAVRICVDGCGWGVQWQQRYSPTCQRGLYTADTPGWHLARAMQTVLCGAADPEPGVRLSVSFPCQKLLEAGTCQKQLGKGYVFDYSIVQLS